MSTKINGIFQGDVVLRSAVVTALKEIRDNPSLIDDVLAGLPQDDLTAGRYGDKTIEQCKKWFLNTNVPVRLGLVLAQLKSPIIVISMNQNAEEQATLGDVNYETAEVDPKSYPVANPGFIVASVTPTTVVVTTDIAAWVPAAGTLNVSGTAFAYSSWTGRTFTVTTDPSAKLPGDQVRLVNVLAVSDEDLPVDAMVPTAASFVLNAVTYSFTGLDRTNGVFTGITPALPLGASGTMTFPWRRALSSVHSRESYDITVMVEGEPEYLLFLYSLVLFGILRRKEDLLDARGFTRMNWQVGVAGMMDPNLRENFFTRSIQLTGFVQHGWPTYQPTASTLGLVAATEFGGQFAPAVSNPEGTATSVPQTPTEPPPPGHDPFQESDWADRDMLSGAPTPAWNASAVTDVNGGVVTDVNGGTVTA